MTQSPKRPFAAKQSRGTNRHAGGKGRTGTREEKITLFYMVERFSYDFEKWLR